MTTTLSSSDSNSVQVPIHQQDIESPTSNSNESKKDYKDCAMHDILDLMHVGKFHYFLFALCGISFFSTGMLLILLIFVPRCAGIDWNLSNSEEALITSCLFLGVLFGSLFWGPFSDKYGRRLAFLAANIMLVAAGFATGVSPNYGSLLAFRFLIGFASGGGTVPFDLLAEFLPGDARGQFLNNINYLYTFGELLTIAIAWGLMDSHGWKLVCIITTIPVAILSMYACWYLPESPMWYLSNDKVNDAEKIIKWAAEMNGTSLPEFSLHPDVNSHANPDQKQTSEGSHHHTNIWTFGFMRLAIPTWILWLTYGFTYYGTILLVSRIYDNESSSEDSCSFEYYPIFINTFTEVVGVFLPSLTVDRWGRVKTIFAFYLLGAAGALLVGMPVADGAVTAFAMISRFTVYGAAVVTWIITPELFSTELRGSVHSFSSCLTRFGALVVPFVVNSNISVLVVSITFAVFNIIAACASLSLPETKDVDLDEIDKLPLSSNDRNSVSSPITKSQSYGSMDKH